MSKVLLIDDNVVITRLYGAALRNAGHRVEVEHDGEAGLAAVVRFKPDVVLLDLALPKTHGLQVLAGIRAHPDSANVPVIVISNTYTNERLQEVWDAGASQVLSKASSSAKQVTEAVRASLAGASGAGR
jgi:Response regulators consisting of a CheY-like receiver domain and a winged-helix DNA-binding domain